MRTSIDALANALNHYNTKQEREEPGNRRRQYLTIGALSAAAVFTLALDILSGCQLHEMIKVYEPINQQATTMQGQLDEMRAEQRPWISAKKIALTEKPQIDANGLGFTFGFVLTNSGHLPASNVSVNLAAFAHQPYKLMTEIPDLERKICGNLGILGGALFPGDTEPLPYSQITYIPKADLDAITEKMVVPTVIACVVYKETGSNVSHHTPYLLKLMVVREGRACCAIPLDEKLLAEAQIEIIEDIFGGAPPD